MLTNRDVLPEAGCLATLSTSLSYPNPTPDRKTKISGIPKKTAPPWQEGLSHPLERLSSMYDNAELSDLTITFPNDERSLKVHRLILAMSSPVFEAMFYGPMAEKADLTLPKDPPKAFIFLLGYIYKGNASLPNVDMAVMVYKLANKYQMSSLFSVCSEYLQSRVDLNNLALVYEMSFLYEDSKLKQKCRKVVSESHEILSSPHIGQLSLQCMEDLLQQKLPVVSEVAVFKGLLRWGKLQTDNSSTSAKSLMFPKSLRQEIETLLPHIRFLTMTVDDIVENVMPSAVLTSEESTAIMMNIKRVRKISLPAICSPYRETRVSNVQLHRISLRSGNHVIKKPTIIKPTWAPVNVDFRLFKEDEEEEEVYFDDSRIPKRPVHLPDECYWSRSTKPMVPLLTNVTLSRDILVGCIEITYLNYGYNRYGSKTVHLKIQNSLRETLSETDVEVNHNGHNYSISNRDNYCISAILQKPVLLSPNNTYSISWSSSDCQQQRHSSSVSLTYGNLNITGVMYSDTDLSLAFWCSSNLF